jgi:transmembrane sensor
MQMPSGKISVEELVCEESFQQYCLGSNLQDQLLWQEWLAAYPDRAEDFESARKLVNLLSLNQGSRLQQLKDLRAGIKQREGLQRSLAEVLSAEMSNPIPVRSRKLYQYIGGVAAAMLVVISIYFFQTGRKEPISRLLSPTTEIAQVISSGQKPRKTVVLPDGTMITLAKGSSIEWRAKFNVERREIWLKGEAFFDVKHDASKPFTVHTEFDDVRVLGTTFNIKAYPNAKEMETFLIKGSVRVNSKQYEGYYVVLKPNQKLVSNKSADVVSDGNPAAHFKVKSTAPGLSSTELKWVKNRLDIEDQPLSEIVLKLRSWYGIDIIIEDESVKNYRYSGIFENETIVKTLEALQLSYPFAFKLEQDRILISK